MSLAAFPAISGADAEVPAKATKRNTPLSETQSPPAAAIQPKYGSCCAAEKATSGVYLPALARGTPLPVCQIGVGMNLLTPPPDEAVCGCELGLSGSFHAPSGM